MNKSELKYEQKDYKQSSLFTVLKEESCLNLNLTFLFLSRDHHNYLKGKHFI